MNNSIEFKRALTEVAMVIHNFPSGLKNKIPIEFKKNVLDKMDISYTPTPFDDNKTLDEQNISEDAKKILASIYKNYLISDEEKKLLIIEEAKIKERLEEEKRKKYNPENVFKSKKNPL